jgi:fucose permease
VEQRLGTSIMSSLHGMWSVGVLTAAFIGSLAAHAHIDARLHFAAAAVVLTTAAVIATAFFTTRQAADEAQEADEIPRFVLPRGPILLIGLVGFCAIFAEIGANDWSAVYLHRTLKSSEALAAAGTGMFALTMATGRLCGDHIVRRIGAGLTVRICGLLGACGGALVVVAPTATPAIIGFMLIGAGVSVVVPLAFAAAGHAGPNPTLGVAGVATISYGAGLAAPGIIGGVADVTSLRVAFIVVTVLAGMVAAGAGLLDRQPSREEPGAAETGALPVVVEG